MLVDRPHDHLRVFNRGISGNKVFQLAERWQSDCLDLKPTLMSNSVHLLRDYGCEHAGIVCLPTLVASDAVVSGTLKVVLADFQLSSFWLSAVYPRTLRGAFKLKLFIESLATSFAGGEPPWDHALIERGVIPSALIEA